MGLSLFAIFSLLMAVDIPGVGAGPRPGQQYQEKS
jgi:hypothetical protein